MNCELSLWMLVANDPAPKNSFYAMGAFFVATDTDSNDMRTPKKPLLSGIYAPSAGC